MAKKQAAPKNGSPSVWASKPEGKPAKQCPSCSKWHHPRSGKCPGCGHEYPKAKAKASKKAARKAAPSNGDFAARLRTATDFVEAMGGLAEAKATLEAIERIRGM